MTTTGNHRIMICGPKNDGTYVIEFRTAAGEALAISIPRTEVSVVRYFQECMPYGLAGRSVRNLWRAHVFPQRSPPTIRPNRTASGFPRPRPMPSGGVLVLMTAIHAANCAFVEVSC